MMTLVSYRVSLIQRIDTTLYAHISPFFDGVYQKDTN